MQNRKSAKKCRLKKKAEFNCLKDDVDVTIRENADLKIKVSLTVLSKEQNRSLHLSNTLSLNPILSQGQLEVYLISSLVILKFWLLMTSTFFHSI